MLPEPVYVPCFRRTLSRKTSVSFDRRWLQDSFARRGVRGHHLEPEQLPSNWILYLRKAQNKKDINILAIFFSRCRLSTPYGRNSRLVTKREAEAASSPEDLIAEKGRSSRERPKRPPHQKPEACREKVFGSERPKQLLSQKGKDDYLEPKPSKRGKKAT